MISFKKRAVGMILLALMTVVPISAQEETITLVTHDSFAISEATLEAFTEETGIAVEVLRAGDAGVLVNQTILSRGAPLGDVLYGIDNTFLTRALEADVFVPYESPMLEGVPGEFLIDPEFRVTPIDYGDVCLNYDTAYFEQNNLAVPESLEDLTEPEYAGLVVVENPATSSPGLAFLLATIGVFGTEGDYTYLNYWEDLTANDVLVVDDWTTAYYTEFSVYGGTRPLVVSYASSPPVEVFFMEEIPENAPTAAITADGTCFRQIEFAGILQGTDQPEAAQQLIDFMLGREFQEDMPLNMFVFPVNPEAEVPELFTTYVTVPENPVEIAIEEIDANREDWIQAWTEVVLR